MPVEMTLEELRTDLAQVMRTLPETGLVRVTRHSKTVADIIPASLEDRRKQARETAELIRRLDEMEMVDLLLDSPVGTLEGLRELLDEWDALKASGVPLDERPYIADGANPSSVEEFLALMYFESDYSSDVDDPVAWFRACADVQRVAHGRGLPTTYPQVYSNEDVPMVIQLVRAGHTPDSFRTFGVHALDQNVQLDQILDLLGEDAVPADVLAHPNYHEYYFEQIQDAGFPLLEASNLVRQRPVSPEDITFVAAGIRTLEDLSRVTQEGIGGPLLKRAVSSGYTFPDLYEVIRKVGKYKYADRGHFDFQVLYQASLEGLSLVRWDQSEVTGKLLGEYGRRGVDPSLFLTMERMKMTPSWVSAVRDFISIFRVEDPEDVWEWIQRLHSAGVSKGLTSALTRCCSRNIYLGPRYSTLDDLMVVISAGLFTGGQVNFLINEFGESLTKWADHLRLSTACQNDVNEFIRGIDEDIWKNILDVFMIASDFIPRSPYIREIEGCIMESKDLSISQVNKILDVVHQHLAALRPVPSHIRTGYRIGLYGDILKIRSTFDDFYEQHMDGKSPSWS